MSRLAAAIIALALPLAAIGSAAAQQRELGSHEHGKGTLNIALEGSRLTMELEAPGADIVGFEHKAKSAKDKAAVANAKKQLAKPLALFRLPSAAGCVLKQASAKLEGEDDHGHDHGHSHAKAKDAKQAPGKAEKDEHEHSQFHAEYALDCKSPAGITTIEFGYFAAFPGAEKLEVNLITPKGQSRFEVTRAKPRLDLSGMM
jgi:hypothetical protein